MAIRIRFGPRRSWNRIEPLAGGLICAALSVLGFYAAFGEAGPSGGIPLIPASWNQAIGRAVFAVGGLITGALALYAFYECLQPARKSRDSDRDQ